MLGDRVKGGTISNETADKLRKALDTMIPVNFNNVPVKDVLDFLQDQTKGLSIVSNVPLNRGFEGGGFNVAPPEPEPITLHLKAPIPIGAVFQFLEDRFNWRFLVREYGIVATTPGRVTPPGAVYLLDLWKDRPADDTKKPWSRSN